MSHQQQFRRGTEAQCNAMTPAEGEIIVDTTNDENRVGDGAKAGGIRMVSAKAVQNQQFNYAVAGGTGNAITLTSPTGAAVTSYVQGLSFEFKASADNTGATTINVDGLGAITVQKPSGSGLTGLSSGDLKSGVIYGVTYNGTVFQLVGGGGGGVTSLTAGDGLSGGTITSSGTISINTNNSVGVGAMVLAAYNAGSGIVANGATTAGSNLNVYELKRESIGGRQTITADTLLTALSGTWRNITGGLVTSTNAQIGFWIRVA